MSTLPACIMHATHSHDDSDILVILLSSVEHVFKLAHTLPPWGGGGIRGRGKEALSPLESLS